jgi:F0F1-type ATP synthase epsilon subunit
MKHSTDTKQELRIIARSPFHVYYEGPAQMVSAMNRIGKFDVLPGHADFFSVMMPGDVQIQTDADTITFPITGGIIGVRDDEVMLFVNM